MSHSIASRRPEQAAGAAGPASSGVATQPAAGLRRAKRPERRVCLVGAGSIAGVHAQVLDALDGVRIVAVVDPDRAAGQRLATAWRVPGCFASAAEALATGEVDAAHVLVPPDLHREAALPFLAAGKPVLLEKPLAASFAECDALIEAARAGGAALGVNQNFLFHPAFLGLRRRLDAGAYGRPRFLDCVYNAPLRQLAARQFGHWMFRAPGNILLEQAVHPLSQVAALAGEIGALRALAGAPLRLGAGVPFHPAVTVALQGALLPAQLRLAVGQAFPFWQLAVVCDDGVLVADMLANRCYAHGRTKWLEPIDVALSGSRTAAALAAAGWGNAAAYGLSLLRLRGRSDPFFRSMQGGIAAFHASLDGDTKLIADGRFGAMLVDTCERIRDTAFEPMPPTATPPAVADVRAASAMAGVATALPVIGDVAAPVAAGLTTPPPADGLAAPAVAVRRTADIAVLGGTGFIGTHAVRRLVAAGLEVSVMARSTRNLAPVFAASQVRVHRGDIRDGAAVAAAIGGAPCVVNLAHGGGGGSYAAVRAAMVGGAETVALVCQTSAVRRLIQVGSIASLYLGPQDAAVTGATPPDPRAAERADYARAKAECDRLLLALYESAGLPVVLLRPGLVVGEGASPFHSGLGVFNNDQHCIGWNAGRNPLPFVLAEDVAEAILLATTTPDIEGRCYNLVGGVRPSARDYIAELAAALGRPLRFHPKAPGVLWAEELGKWAIKRAGGRAAPLPSRRDILSRGLTARFDCADVARDLGWRPVTDPARFAARAIAVHAG